MRIAAIQHDIVWEDRAANYARLADPIASAADSGAHLVLLSEMFPTGFSMDTDRVAEPFDGPTTQFLRERADAHGMWIGGSFACQRHHEGLPTNRFVLAAPDGALHHYDKIHPFSYAREHEAYQAGSQCTSVTIEGVRTSLFVCYDLRFADEFWAVAPATDLYLVPANWPSSRAHHWRSLLTARAIENQAYVVGCNRVGQAGGLRYDGDSMIVDPQGRTLVSAALTETVLVADIEPALVADTRRDFPFLADRRPHGDAASVPPSAL